MALTDPPPHGVPPPGSPDPGTTAPSPDPGPTAPSPDPPVSWASPEASPAAPARRASRWPVIVLITGLVVFMGVVLWVVRDNASIDDLAVGACFDVPTRSEELSTVTRRDCTQPHDAEVFHVVDHGGASEYPSDDAWDEFFETACVPVYETYVGEHIDDSEDLTAGYFFPNAASWDSGDREVTCYANRLDEAKLTQSVKGTR